jgi:hypothetical protein
VRRAARGASLVLMLVALVGCGGYYAGKYREAIGVNRAGIQSLQLGMTESEVRSIMREDVVVRYKGIQFVNPLRSEAFYLADGTAVEILLYQTELQRRYPAVEDSELTPVVFEDDRLVGWGWSYLRRNTDRYRVSVPREQR